jgi:inosine/xanthosine triphosphatase
MPLIAVASTNPVKIDAALGAFNQMFPDEEWSTTGHKVNSGVADQPMSDEETLQGALNRVDALLAIEPDADYYVALEGGCSLDLGELSAFAWAVVRGKDGKMGKSRTGQFYLPPAIQELVAEGKELGEADDIVFKRSGSAQSNGAIGILMDDVITRTSYYEHAMVMALIPFKKPELYN